MEKSIDSGENSICVIYFFATLVLIGIHFPPAANAQNTTKTVPLAAYKNEILDSGGILLREQAAYNVHYYDLDLFVDPSDSTIHGSVIAHVQVLEQLDKFVVHLDTVFHTERVIRLQPNARHTFLDYTHENGLIVASLQKTAFPGQNLIIEISYHGQPRSAPNPPWEGGVTWGKTVSDDPWIGVSCQLNGADIWWPIKDHPSDRPDSVSLKITVPENLTVVSNGVLRSINSYSPDTKTFHWVTNYPVNNYAISINIGPYEKIYKEFTSISGDTFPINFWVLPENRKKAEVLMEQIVEHMRFFENILSPYPFRHEKYGVVEAPFLGMEHQTLIAYGAGYENDVVFETDSGFDDLHHHELAHEWWGNLVTASDWKDFWIHEGFGTYMQPLYSEYLHGKEKYLQFMNILYDRIKNNQPIVPEKSRSTREMFVDRDIYMKGAWVLHSLRFLIGDHLFFQSLKHMTFPDSTVSLQKVPNRYVDTHEYITIVEDLLGEELDWFFDTYLHYAELPVLEQKWDENELILKWNGPSGKRFIMPIEIYDGEELITVIPDGIRSVTIRNLKTYEIDPDSRVLRSGMFE